MRLNRIVKSPGFELDSFPVETELDRLWRAAWGAPLPAYPAGKPARQRFALRPEAEATPLRGRG
jgi:hypothetical protein